MHSADIEAAKAYQAYLKAIDSVAACSGFKGRSYTADSGPEYWADAYGDGWTPKEAYEEDTSCAHDFG